MKQKLLNSIRLRLLMLLAVLVSGINAAWGDETTYTFTSKSWAATSGGDAANWTSGKDGNAMQDGRGIQVTTGATGANGTSPVSFTNVTKVVVTYSTNATKGAGDIEVKIGTNSKYTHTITSTGGTTDRTEEFNMSPSAESGNVKITVNCTTNSIYIKSVAITHAAPAPAVALSSIALSGSYPTSFHQGDAFSHEGMIVTATYADDSQANVTASATFSGYNMGETGAQTVTVSYTENEVTKTATYGITVNAIPTHTATFSVNGNTTSEDFQEGADIDFPDDPEDINGKKFRGWVAAPIVGTTNIEPSFVTSATMSTNDVTYYAVFATETPGVETNVTKTITTSTANLPTSYGTANTFTTYTLEGVKFKIQQMYKNGEKLQWRASGHDSGTGTMYNTDALNKIQSIVLTYDASDGNKNFTVEVGDGENPTGGTSITPTNDESVYTFDCSSYNKSYFVLTNGTNAGYLTSVAVTYKEIGPTTYSAYCTTVSVLPVPTITFKDGEENAITTLNANCLNAFIPVSVTCSAGDVTLSFESSNDKVAEYDEGYVLTYAEGTATITATFAGNEDYQGTSATLTVNVERATTTLSFPATPATINIGASATYAATGSPSVSGITYSSSNTSALTVNSATGEITGVAKGSATITASFAGNDNYKAAEKSYTIRVVNPNEITYTLTNSQIVSGGPDAASGYGTKAISDANDKTWNAYAIKNQHSNQTSGYHYLQIRAYNNPTAYYIQVPAYGTRITELQMTVSGSSAPMGNAGNTATLFFSASNTTSAEGDGVASGTGESTVTIDCSALNLNTGYITADAAVRIWDVKVTYEYALPVGSAKWTSHVTADAVDFTGVTAYIATQVNAETISLKEVTSAPANTPVIIKGDDQKTYYLQTKYSSLDNVTGNLLQASDGSVTGDGSTIYALGVGKTGVNEGVVGFYLVNDGQTIPAGKAYLNTGASVKEFLTFDFDDATAVSEVKNEGVNSGNSIFNLAGQKMSKLQKGVNIVNGKKVLVK